MRILAKELKLLPSRVARGVAHLDKTDPGWWRVDHPKSIELETLNMGSICNCIVGQRQGEYNLAPEGIPLSTNGGVPFGFDMPALDTVDDPIEAHVAYYPALKAEWVRIIRERRSAV